MEVSEEQLEALLSQAVKFSPASEQSRFIVELIMAYKEQKDEIKRLKKIEEQWNEWQEHAKECQI